MRRRGDRNLSVWAVSLALDRGRTGREFEFHSLLHLSLFEQGVVHCNAIQERSLTCKKLYHRQVQVFLELLEHYHHYSDPQREQQKEWSFTRSVRESGCWEQKTMSTSMPLHFSMASASCKLIDVCMASSRADVDCVSRVLKMAPSYRQLPESRTKYCSWNY